MINLTYLSSIVYILGLSNKIFLLNYLVILTKKKLYY